MGQDGGTEGARVGPWARMGARPDAKGGTKLRREDDDDSLDGDDSDVEVMSISSDEEEAKGKRTYKPGGEGIAPSYVASVPSGGKVSSCSRPESTVHGGEECPGRPLPPPRRSRWACGSANFELRMKWLFKFLRDGAVAMMACGSSSELVKVRVSSTCPYGCKDVLL